MLHTIAVDDEPMALEIVKNLSSQVPFIRLDACFTNAFEAISFLQENKIDLILLDIRMPDLSGFDFLNSISSQPMVIFTTAYSEHAVNCFELNAIDYLLKPFSMARFLKACNKAFEYKELHKNKLPSADALPSIFIKSGYEHVRVDLDKILYCESLGNYIKFGLTDTSIVSRLTISEAELLLPSSNFIRVHRSIIVSKKYITKVDKRTVWIQNHEFPISSSYSSEIEKFYQR